MAMYQSKYTGQQIDDGIENAVRVTEQSLTSSQKQQARANIGVTDEVQLGGNTPSSDSSIKLFVDESSDNEAEVFTKAQTLGGFVAVVNANSAPTSSTLTYTATDGTTKNFKVGDEINVSGTFYKLYALSTVSDVTTATWKKLVDESSVITELVIIRLTSTEGNNDQNLIGATVIVTNDSESETILSSTWQGTDIFVQVKIGISYTITVGNVQGYGLISNHQSYTSLPFSVRNVNFQYIGGAIDLGLPSGTLWCSHNVGAVNPEDYGNYFSWGNIVGHVQGDGHAFTPSNYENTLGNTLTASFTSGDSTYDAARAIMGGQWRIPTHSEVTELVENTDYVKTTINNVLGMKFMKKTDNSIYVFFPAAGNADEGGYTQIGDRVVVWDTEYYNSIQASCLFVTNISTTDGNVQSYPNYPRHRGISIRGVI